MPDASSFKISLLTSGNINRTYRVTFKLNGEESSIILQSINNKIFEKPEKLISNYIAIEEYFNYARGSKFKFLPSTFIPKLLINAKNNNKYTIYDGEFWRAFEYIRNLEPNTNSFSFKLAKSLGKGLADFHNSFKNFNRINFTTSIPFFHDLDYYLSLFDEAKKSYNFEKNSTIVKQYIVNIVNKVETNKEYYSNFYRSVNSLQLTKSLIHADPKISNFLFDDLSLSVKSIIDLDTIRYDSILYDISDCLRSACNSLGEDSIEFNLVQFDIATFEKVLKGYYSAKPNLLREKDLYYLPKFLELVTYELSIRFATDFLCGNKYFHVDNLLGNLYRSIIQLKLLDDIRDKSEAISSILRNLTK